MAAGPTMGQAMRAAVAQQVLALDHAAQKGSRRRRHERAAHPCIQALLVEGHHEVPDGHVTHALRLGQRRLQGGAERAAG